MSPLDALGDDLTDAHPTGGQFPRAGWTMPHAGIAQDHLTTAQKQEMIDWMTMRRIAMRRAKRSRLPHPTLDQQISATREQLRILLSERQSQS